MKISWMSEWHYGRLNLFLINAKQSSWGNSPEHRWMMVDSIFFVATEILECVWIVPPNRQLYIYKGNYREWNRNPYTEAN